MRSGTNTGADEILKDYYLENIKRMFRQITGQERRAFILDLTQKGFECDNLEQLEHLYLRLQVYTEGRELILKAQGLKV